MSSWGSLYLQLGLATFHQVLAVRRLLLPFYTHSVTPSLNVKPTLAFRGPCRYIWLFCRLHPLSIPPSLLPSLHLSSPLCLTHAHGATYIPPYSETSHRLLLRGRYYDSILNIAAVRKRPRPVTDQPPVTSASSGGSNAEQHGRGTISQHILDRWGWKKKTKKIFLGLKLRPSPPRRTPSLTLTQHLISQVPKPEQSDAQRERQRKREVEGRGRTRGVEGWGVRAGRPW